MALRIGYAAVWLLAATFDVVAGEPITPEMATEMLARSQAINNKCQVLDEGERQELSDIVATAEIALAEKVSVMAARTALARGKQSGVATICDGAAAQLVHDTLIAAKSARVLDSVINKSVVVKVQPVPKLASVIRKVGQDDPQSVAAAPGGADANVETIVSDTPAASAPKVTPPPKRIAVVVPPKAKPVKSSGAFVAMAESYYRELRCKRLSFTRVNAMYKRVLAAHKTAVAAQGRANVRQMLQAAKSRSAGISCGA